MNELLRVIDLIHCYSLFNGFNVTSVLCSRHRGTDVKEQN